MKLKIKWKSPQYYTSFSTGFMGLLEKIDAIEREKRFQEHLSKSMREGMQTKRIQCGYIINESPNETPKNG